MDETLGKVHCVKPQQSRTSYHQRIKSYVSHYPSNPAGIHRTVPHRTRPYVPIRHVTITPYKQKHRLHSTRIHHAWASSITTAMV